MEEVIEILSSSSEEAVAQQDEYQVYVPGHPMAMPRPRKFANGFVNLRSKDLVQFKATVKAAIPAASNGPLFPTGPVELTIWFLLQRPQCDFVGKRRQAGNLKSTATTSESTFPAMTPDVDNLAKFVMDGLNGIAYRDDAQVVKLVAYRMRDNNGSCDGGTIINIAKFKGFSSITLPTI